MEHGEVGRAMSHSAVAIGRAPEAVRAERARNPWKARPERSEGTAQIIKIIFFYPIQTNNFCIFAPKKEKR